MARVPLDRDWQELTEGIELEREQNPDTPLYDLGKELLDFYVCPEGYIFDSVQFVPNREGFIFTTVIGDRGSQVWLFAANCLKQGPVAKLSLPETVDFGFTLHSEYFAKVTPRKSHYNVDRFRGAVRSAIKVPYEFFTNRSSGLLNRKVD